MKRPLLIILLAAGLLLTLAGIGAVVFFTLNSGGGLIFNFDQNLAAVTVEESKTLKVNGKVKLIVNNDAGDVIVVGGDVKTVQVKIEKTGNAPTQSRAEEDLKNIKYEIKQDGNNITLLYSLKGINSNHVDTVDFIVTVPNETTVSIDANMGKVNISNTKGNLGITNDFGKISAENIEGALTIKNNSGEVNVTAIKAGKGNIDLQSDFGEITLTQVSGSNITVGSNSGEITLTDVHATGDIITKTDFGSTKFENGSANSLHIEANSGKVVLTKLKITKEIFVDDDFGDLELNQANAGSYDLHTNSGGVTVNGAKNKLKAYTDFGNITVESAQSVTLDLKTNSGQIQFSGSLGEGPHMIKSDFGQIDLTLPADSKLNVDLKTDFGGISSDIPLTVTLDGDSDKDHQIGTMNGGGDLLTAITNSGNISIKTPNK